MSTTLAVNAARSALPALGPHAPGVRLTARRGAESWTHELKGEPVAIIGSRRDCSLPIDNADVSKIHCAIINTGRDVYACDLRTRGSTFLNGSEIQIQQLANGDRLRIADCEIQIDIIGNPPVSDDAAPGQWKMPRPMTLSAGESIYDLDHGISLIGRRTTCDIRIDSPDVSQVHALVFPIDGRPVVCDLGSRGGTYLNGRRSSLAWLNHGDSLRIGNDELSVRSKPAATESDRLQSEKRGRTAMAEESLILDSELQEIEATIAALQGSIESSRKRLDDQARQLAQREQQMTALAADLAQREARVAELQALLEQRSRDLESSESELKAQRGTIEQQTAAAAAQQAEIAKLRETIETRERELHAAQQQIEARSRELEAARHSLETQTAETQSLRQKQEAELARQKAGVEKSEAELLKMQVELESQQAQLAQRQADVDKRHAEAEQRRAELDTRRSEMEKLQADVAASRAECERKAVEVEQRSAAQAQAEADAAKREAEFARRQAEIEKRQAEQERRSAELEQQKAAVSESSASLAQREAALAEREAALHSQDEEIQRRKSQLQHHESETAGVAQRLSKFKSQLQNATKMFTTDSFAGHEPNESPADPAAGVAVKPDAPASAPSSAPAASVSTAAAAPMSAPGLSELSPAQQDRFKVLKRLTGKSDADVIAQVVAESSARSDEPHADEKPGKGKKRSWW